MPFQTLLPRFRPSLSHHVGQALSTFGSETNALSLSAMGLIRTITPGCLRRGRLSFQCRDGFAEPVSFFLEFLYDCFYIQRALLSVGARLNHANQLPTT